MGQTGIEGEERGLTHPSQPETLHPVSGIVPDARITCVAQLRVTVPLPATINESREMGSHVIR